MPDVFESTVELMTHTDLVNYTIDNTPAVYDGIAAHVNDVLRRTPSLNPDEAWGQACADILRENGYSVTYNGNGKWTSCPFQNIKQLNSTPNPFNSNTSTIARGNFRQMYGSIREFDGTNHFMQISRLPVSGGLGAKAQYLVGSVGSAITAVSAGVWAGKALSRAIYDSMPDYWESIGMGTFNPDTWRGLTNDEAGPFAGLFNFILGLDPDTGQSQAYMNQDALAYMLYVLKQNGWFDAANQSTVTNPVVDGTILTGKFVKWTESFSNIRQNDIRTRARYDGYVAVLTNGGYLSPILSWRAGFTDPGPLPLLMTAFRSESSIYYIWPTNDYTNDYIPTSMGIWNPTTGNNSGSTSTFSGSYAYDGKTVHYRYYRNDVSNLSSIVLDGPSMNFDDMGKLAWFLYYGEWVPSSVIDGVSDQPNAQLPDVSTWDSMDDVLPSLQQQYPSAFANPMVWNSDDPTSDTSGNTTTYIPVPFPDFNNMTDKQPTSGTQNQTSTRVDTLPADLLQTIMNTIQAPNTQTSTQPQTPPANPSDTGAGVTPTPTPAVGNASALWSVYHPTQAQVNSFGGWLWGSPFLTNIGKLFENPIDGVISLHKIYAPPVDSETKTIVVGTLDSQVPSVTVNQQYVTVDCGSVSCQEDFGNVFDYPPFTKVSLYLPFVGIVPLDTNDVMRSTIHVIYGVDVFTGACIAMVEVTRDGNTINMYQYTGNCAVHYPLSNVQHSQLLSGLLSVAAGVGSIVASGGVSTPAVAGIVHGAATAGNTSIGRSGGFSANAGAMGIKKPYIIIQRPQTKVAQQFTTLAGYPTNISGKLSDFSGQVNVTFVHVEGINATDNELSQIETLLKDGVLV